VLENERALEIPAAVEPGRQAKMSFEERAARAEQVEYGFGSHALDDSQAQAASGSPDGQYTILVNCVFAGTVYITCAIPSGVVLAVVRSEST
jgi:hypothetical protein